MNSTNTREFFLAKPVVLCVAPLLPMKGHNMWLAFPSLFHFGDVSKVSTKFIPTCNIFYDLTQNRQKRFGGFHSFAT
jgi:hypothetical protein